jgi:tetratricopeptide (TPR) repeat protein
MRSILLCNLVVVAYAFVFGAEIDHQQQYQQEFESALAEYQSGHLDQAATSLESLVEKLPQSFDVHELLGMVYSAQGRKQQASEHLEKAVRLNPNSAAARTNLATTLVQTGKLGSAEAEFKRALALDPRSYDTNHNLGEFYVTAGKIPLAVSFLETAQTFKPDAYDNGYDLALAYVETGKNTEAQRAVAALLKQKDTAELHSLLGEIQEKNRNYVAAEHEYETAAHMDPSESNLFDWGSELLLHRTLDPAVEVFQRGTQRYPQSQRLAIGLGMALYSRGNYDDAVKALLKAADLNPSDPRCYYFLSKAYDSSPAQADDVIQRFRRFAELEPQNAQALYYYAMSLWKGRRAQDADANFQQVESLLKKSIERDSKFPEAHLQLGNLYSDQKRYDLAVPQYEQALVLNANLPDAHYRLAQAFVHTGNKESAQRELEIYQQQRAQHLAELEKQRSEIRQFVYSAKGAPAGN